MHFVNVHLQRELKICSHFLRWVWMVSFQENRFSQCCLLMLNLRFVMLQYKYKSLLMWDDASSQEVCRSPFLKKKLFRYWDWSRKIFPQFMRGNACQKGSQWLFTRLSSLSWMRWRSTVCSLLHLFFHFCKDLIWLFPFFKCLCFRMWLL